MRRVALLVLFCSSFSCGGEGGTAVDVTLDVDGCLTDLVARIEVTVFDGEGAEVARFDQGSPSFPTGVRIVRGDTDRWSLEAHVYPRASARPLGRVRAAGTFTDGVVTPRALLFEDRCVGVLCAGDGASCVAGECVDEAALAPETSVTPADASSCLDTVFLRAAPACGGPDDPTCGDTSVTRVEVAADGCTLEGAARYETQVENEAGEPVGDFSGALNGTPVTNLRIVGEGAFTIDARVFESEDATPGERAISRVRATGDLSAERHAVLFEDQCFGIVCAGDRTCVDGACADASPAAPESVTASAASACDATIVAPACGDSSCPETSAVELTVDADACVVAKADEGVLMLSGSSMARRFTIDQLPLTFRLIGDIGEWTADVDLLGDSEVVARTRTLGDFRTLARAAHFQTDCLGTVCGAGETCSGGTCVATAEAPVLTDVVPDPTDICPNIAFASNCYDSLCETFVSRVNVTVDSCLANLAERRETWVVGADGSILFGPLEDTTPSEDVELWVVSDGAPWSVHASLHTERSERPIAEGLVPVGSRDTLRLQDECLGVLCSRPGASCVDGRCVDLEDLAATEPTRPPAEADACPGIFFASAGTSDEFPIDCSPRTLSLYDAVQCVNENGGLIEVLPGTYDAVNVSGGTFNRDASGAIIVADPVFRMPHATVRGHSADMANRPVIDGRASGDFRTLLVERPYLTIDSLVVRGGRRVISVNAGCDGVDTDADGVEDACVSVLDEIEIRRCEAYEVRTSTVDTTDPYEDRAGIVITNGANNVLVEDSVFRSNVAATAEGGGAYISDSTNVRFRHNRVVGNGPRGLAMYGLGTTAEISDNRFCTNDIELGGGTVAFLRNSVVGVSAAGDEGDIAYVSGDAVRIAALEVRLEQNIFAWNAGSPVTVATGTVMDRRNLFYENGALDASFTQSMPDTDRMDDPRFVEDPREDTECTLLLADDSPARNDDPALAIGAQ